MTNTGLFSNRLIKVLQSIKLAKREISFKTEIARLSTLAITQTNIIIKYSLINFYGEFVWRVTKKNCPSGLRLNSTQYRLISIMITKQKP